MVKIAGWAEDVAVFRKEKMAVKELDSKEQV